MNQDYWGIKRGLLVNNRHVSFFSLRALQKKGFPIARLPFCIRVLLENALRHFDGYSVTQEHVEALLEWTPVPSDREVPFVPARVLMQDFTGVPAVVDLASLRSEVVRQGRYPAYVNPLIPVDLVIDHSVQVDFFGTPEALVGNVKKEYERNSERYSFLKWAQSAFDNFSVVPPGMGICHQVNLEYLSKCVIERDGLVFPDSLVGTDSHTPMVNGLGIFAYGVGGIEAEAAMLGQPQFFALPEVVGLRLTGKLPAGSTATDLVLTLTELLRRTKVVNKFVEVFGDGLDTLSVPDRATIGNMSPEFGCTVTYFPVDRKTLQYLEKTNRPAELIELTRRYAQENLLWRENEDAISYSQVVELDLASVEPVLSGPGRPQDKILLREAKEVIAAGLEKKYYRKYVQFAERPLSRWADEGGNVEIAEALEAERADMRSVRVVYNGERFFLSDGDVVVAAITSCTNTSNPHVMIAAGLLAEKALQKGLKVKPWVKTSLAPGSKVVTDYLEESGLLARLEEMRFNLVGYGCTTCIGNSGPLPGPIAEAITGHDLIVASVLSGNRNFEARIHPQIKLNFLMSPPLVVAYAICGRMDMDMGKEPLGWDLNGKAVFLKDIWPAEEEIQSVVDRVVKRTFYEKNYGGIFDGEDQWKRLRVPLDKTYRWDVRSTYVREAPFFRNIPIKPLPLVPIAGARVLLSLGNSVTTDHISPAGSFDSYSSAGQYLSELGVPSGEFNSYGSRRGNDEVMTRGTFANIRLRNKLAVKEGGFTRYLPTGEEMTVYDAAMLYKKSNTPLLVLAGTEYGSGSSRDWAAKGTALLGIRAVIAEGYERIHRSNLVGMGVLPLQYVPGENADSLGLDGTEAFTISGMDSSLHPARQLTVSARHENGTILIFKVLCRLDSKMEIDYYRNGGILPYMLRHFLSKEK